MLTCTLKVAQTGWGTNSSETAFTMAVEVPAATAAAPATTATTVAAAKDKHIKYIKSLLDSVNSSGTGSREVRVALTKALYDYLTDEALEFVKAHEKFRAEVVKKAYELKTEAPYAVAMCDSINRVLLALGQPLVKPAPAPAPAPAAVAVPSSSDSEAADLALLAAVAKKCKCDSVLRATKEYLGYWRRAANRGDYRGLSKAQAMEKYISSWWCFDEDTLRERLLQEIFNKRKLVYSPVIMDMYTEWQKTYVPPPRVRGKSRPNRYTKMCAFIEENKSAFTTL
jgi:hypothetical protein